MALRRLLRLNAGFLLLGLAIAALWLHLTGGTAQLRGLLRVAPGYLVLLLAITAFCLFMRFVRWHFLLRRVGVRVPTRPSLSIFLASLVGTATPAYVGEVVRGVFMRRTFGTPFRVTTTVLVVERLFDVAALGLIGALTADTWWVRAVMLLLIAAVWLIALAGGGLARNLGVPAGVVAPLGTRSIQLGAFGLSLTAWVPAALLVSLVAASLGTPVAPLSGMRVFSTATLFGAITLMPAGVGSTGSLAILQLQGLGLSLAHSVVVVSLIRLVTIGASLLVASVFLVRELRALKRPAQRDSAIHFNEIAWEYSHQFSPHIWSHLLDRRIGLLSAALPNPPAGAGLGVDLGCGLGQQCLKMGERGYSVIGLDAAQNLVRQARQAGATVATGSALALPFRDASLGFTYTVGVLHHLPGVSAQQAACREVARVLKPGGLFMVHETNPRNPLFRFYMGYVFPILKSIDEGTEWWIEPQRWERMDGLKLVDLQYFTFLPDFVPKWLMRPLLAVERWFEAGPLRTYSVHYMAVLRKAS